MRTASSDDGRRLLGVLFFGNRNVEESHERNDLFRDPCDLFSTAADADEE